MLPNFLYLSTYISSNLALPKCRQRGGITYDTLAGAGFEPARHNGGTL